MKDICRSLCLILFAIGTAVSQTTVTTTGGTANSVPKFSGSSTVVNSAITEVNGKVGIGTSNPQRSFDVQTSDPSNFHTSVLVGFDNNQGATLFVNGPIIAQFQESLLYGTGACCNTGGLGNTGGSSLGSTAGFSASFDGAFFNANGTADGDGNTGHQINTALPSWRMALGSGTSEWPGGDNFAIGRVAADGNYQAPTIFFSISNAGKMKVSGGVDATGGGVKHARGGGCSSMNQHSCSVTVSWPGAAFPDTNYTAVCTPEGTIATGTLSIASKSTSSITLSLSEELVITGSTVAGMSGVDCIAMHD